MKILYWSTTVYYLNDKEVKSFTRYNWHYGELPENRILKDFNIFEDFYEEYGYDSKKLFTHEPYVPMASINSDALFGKITKDKFTSYKIMVKYSEVNCLVTMEDLMNRLTAEDFITYCKDHGMSVCPLK